jgi:hypothetical protein
MNMFKKLAIVAAFLCAATIVTAQEENGMKIGARVGYSMQQVDMGTGMLGFGVGLVFDIPAGPVFISPGVALLHRNNFDLQTDPVRAIINPRDIWLGKFTQPEFAVSIPILFKFFPMSSSYLSLGVQADIPINPEVCYESDCYSMDGKKSVYTRASYDISILIGAGYRVTPALVLDFRTTFGLTPHYEYELNQMKVESAKMGTYGFGISYFFL